MFTFWFRSFKIFSFSDLHLPNLISNHPSPTCTSTPRTSPHHSHFKSAVYQASSPWKAQSQRAHQSPPSWESSHAASAAAPHSRCFRRIRRWPAPAAVDRAHGKRRPGAPAARNGRPNAPPRSSAPGKQTDGQQDMTGNLKPNRPNWGILTWSSVGISRV